MAVNQPLLPPLTGTKDQNLVPVRMVGEWVYCPRLAYLMWVDGEWADTSDTEDGRRVHARTDRARGRIPDPDRPADDEAAPFVARSVTLASERLGIIAKMDVIEGQGRRATPIDFKRGKRPHIPKGAYEPERVQVCAQALILEENGYEVEEGALWFAASRERVRVALDEELRAKTLSAVSDLRQAADDRQRPPPLEDSPKCPRCALAGICLPDEVNFLHQGQTPRMLNPADDPALPLHLQEPGAKIRKSGEELLIETEEGDRRIPIIEVSEVALYGPVSVTTPAMHELFRRDIPVTFHSTGGWFLGRAAAPTRRALDTRIAQFRMAGDPVASQRIGAELIAAKIRNQRTMLRRNWKHGDSAIRDADLARLKRLAVQAASVQSADSLLGVEGEAAAIYFHRLPAMIAPDRISNFDFKRRNRRPPEDPVNALLSFAYALATRTLTNALETAGFDPLLGFFHRPRPRRPALALDMMEPFRPILCDSVVLTAINNGEVRETDFISNGPSCALKPAGRRSFIAAWERRLDQETTHPLFGYRLTMRRLIAVQCRLLGRHVCGEIPTMPHYVPR